MPLEFASFSFLFFSLYLSFALSYIKTSFFSIEGKNRTSYFSFILVEAAVKRSIQRDFLVKNIPLRVNREFDWTVLSAKRMVCSVFRDKIEFFLSRDNSILLFKVYTLNTRAGGFLNSFMSSFFLKEGKEWNTCTTIVRDKTVRSTPRT